MDASKSAHRRPTRGPVPGTVEIESESDSSRWGESACLATSREARPRPGRNEGPPPLISFSNIVKDGTPDQRALHDPGGRAGTFNVNCNLQLKDVRSGTPVYRAHLAPGGRVFRSSCVVLRSATVTGSSFRLRLRLRRDKRAREGGGVPCSLFLAPRWVGWGIRHPASEIRYLGGSGSYHPRTGRHSSTTSVPRTTW